MPNTPARTITGRIARWGAALAAVTIGGSAVVGCGDDQEATHEQFFEAACEQIAGIDIESAFAQFFNNHPETSLDDWAEFLPHVIGEMDEMVALAELPHPSSDDAGLAAVEASVLAVQDNFRKSLDAAKAGDQATFDELSDKNQGVDVPAMEAAMQAVDPRDCPGTPE
jgi:hypothetical protein